MLKQPADYPDWALRIPADKMRLAAAALAEIATDKTIWRRINNSENAPRPFTEKMRAAGTANNLVSAFQFLGFGALRIGRGVFLCRGCGDQVVDQKVLTAFRDCFAPAEVEAYYAEGQGAARWRAQLRNGRWRFDLLSGAPPAERWIE